MKGRIRILTICLLMWQCACELKVCGPKLGCVRGKYMPGYDTEKFEAFIGIPYALPPVNKLRFRSPQAALKFSGVYDATNIKSDCIQKNDLLPIRAVQGAEDCLYLNVYRPVTKNSQSLLPVMVYIHGGGWFSGSGTPLVHGPEYFMDTKEVVLVTFNYRLGLMGFLSTNDKNMPGNFGLKDQNLALRWVQKNIASFGGNPKKVTIFGQSAGAISAHMHILSKKSNGLFHRAILLSGTANVPFAITKYPLNQARELAKHCKIPNAKKLNTAKLVQALQNVDAATLVNAADNLKYWDVDPLTSFRPVVENASLTDAFLTQHPTQTLTKGIYNAVPTMLSFVENEGAVRAIGILESPKLRSSFNEDFDHLLEELLDLPKYLKRTRKNQIMSKIIDEYFDGQHELNGDSGRGLVNVITDRGFRGPLYDVIDTYVNTMNTVKNPIYLIKFNYKGANTYANLYAGGSPSRDYGVVHCDDLAYLFRSPLLFPDFAKNSTDANVTRAFVKNFVHFAKNSTPQNYREQDFCNSTSFTSTKNAICDYQEITNSKEGSFEIRTTNRYDVEHVQFWKNILAKPRK